MTDKGTRVRDAVLKRAGEIGESDPGFANFLALTVAGAEDQDLSDFAPETLESLLGHAFANLGRRADNNHLIDIWSPEPGPETGFDVIDIFVANMPFLVDSVLAAIRSRGIGIRLIAHPILPLDYDLGHPRVMAAPTDDTLPESFLHIHVDPVANDAREALKAELDDVLREVRRTVEGWRPMLERLRQLVQDYRQKGPKIAPAVLAETLHFLAWLADHNFTFLGMREYTLATTDGHATLEPVKKSGLGILIDPDFHFLRSATEFVEMTGQHVAFLEAKEPLMVTKANVRSRVHRRAYMDYVGVKLYDEAGALTGELRILGLFTSMSLATPHTEVPLIRRKISEVMRRSGFDPQGHAGKALMAALDNYPRDELFQISEDDLFRFANIIATLPDRPRIRVLPRIDHFDNFVSILVYMPRDRYDSGVRARIGEHLATRYDGRISTYYPHFPEGELVRVHFIIGRNGGPTPRPEREDLEAEIETLTRTFGDLLHEAASDPSAIADYLDAFSPAYQTQNSHTAALNDIAVFNELGTSENIAVRLTRPDSQSDEYDLRVYHAGSPIPLSDRVPMLENFGFRVIDETTFLIRPRDGLDRWVHAMAIRPADASATGLTTIAPILEQALVAVWNRQAESDGFNQLTVSAAMPWDDVAILRALGRYLKQIGLAFSQRYIWTALAAHPDAAEQLVALFHTRHDPHLDGDRDKAAQAIHLKIIAALESVSSADEDQIIRHFLNLVEVSLRTNFYQRGEDGTHRPALAIKFDSPNIDGLPQPRPFCEITVYSSDLEGIHLRGGAIARGGLRWSDRPEDFRTEVLGLVKAQMVKNAVIVPVGAKGGFVPKTIPADASRETQLAIGTAAYKTYIGALLDITDNLEDDRIVPPPDVVRHDGDDPYLVVAADKGTASFSDTANAISQSRDYWLDDAFASGGSAGYDHKKMGITARGGWEAVKRHFREIDRDIQSHPFTAAGVGDMSGDVFGNGMLLSRHTRLVAAFDHRDIFIDPDPEPEASYLERQRLFRLPKSSWQDYDTGLLSEGGGIYSRGAKTLDLSAAARKLLDLGAEQLTPQKVMQAILKIDVDLLWFGGIGTYIRAASETNADAGDRANDALRIAAPDVRAKVIGEGANLGVTQKARIEYALKGGRINTDAIDNSAGVNSSDLEVNIKIALGALVRAGKMTVPERNAFLVEMTAEVGALCLRNNYLQTLALSLAERRGMAALPDLITFMQDLESKGRLDRAIEFLPDDAALAERGATGQPLTRPELAVLLAYAKNTLFADLLDSPVPDDRYLGRELYRYFPPMLKQHHSGTIEGHRLRREVIATVLANAMINRGGPAFVHRLTQATSASVGDVAFAYAAARDAYGLTELNADIDALDNRLKGATQLDLYAEVETLMVDQTIWFLRNAGFASGVGAVVERYRDGVSQVRAVLGSVLPEYIAQSVADQAVRFVNGGAPRDLARRIAELSALTLASDIVLIGERADATIAEAAEAYFKVLEIFGLGRVTEQRNRINLADRFDRMALDRALANLMRAQRDLTADVLAAGDGPVPGRIEAWRAARAAEIDRTVGLVTTLTDDDLTVSRLSVAAGILSDLVRNP